MIYFSTSLSVSLFVRSIIIIIIYLFTGHHLLFLFLRISITLVIEIVAPLVNR